MKNIKNMHFDTSNTKLLKIVIFIIAINGSNNLSVPT